MPSPNTSSPDKFHMPEPMACLLATAACSWAAVAHDIETIVIKFVSTPTVTASCSSVVEERRKKKKKKKNSPCALDLTVNVAIVGAQALRAVRSPNLLLSPAPSRRYNHVFGAGKKPAPKPVPVDHIHARLCFDLRERRRPSCAAVELFQTPLHLSPQHTAPDPASKVVCAERRLRLLTAFLGMPRDGKLEYRTVFSCIQ